MRTHEQTSWPSEEAPHDGCVGSAIIMTKPPKSMKQYDEVVTTSILDKVVPKLWDKFTLFSKNILSGCKLLCNMFHRILSNFLAYRLPPE